MKKSAYIDACNTRARGFTPKGGWGRVFSPETTGKLERKAAEGKVGNVRGGVVSRAYETMARSKRAA